MFPDANHFVIHGSTFYEQHIHPPSPPPLPPRPSQNNPFSRSSSSSSSPPRPKPTQFLPPGQYLFQNCENPNAMMCPALVRYISNLPGVAEILEVGFPGKAWVAIGNICTETEVKKAGRWFFEKVGTSEWIYIRPYDQPSKTLTGRVVLREGVSSDSLLEDIEHLGAPIQMFKPIPLDVPPNSGIIPPGYYYFQNLKTGGNNALTYVQYKEDELGVAVIAEVEMPGLYWMYTGNACQATREASEWFIEYVYSEDGGGSRAFDIYPRNHPKRILSGEIVDGSPLGDLRIRNREPEFNALYLWKAIPVDLPDHSGVLPAGTYVFTNLGSKFQTNTTRVEYDNTPGRIGAATLSIVSHPDMYWISTEVTCTGGSVPSEWFFQHMDNDLYYICPMEQPYPKTRVVSGVTIDGDASGDYLVQDKIRDQNDVNGILLQLWMAKKV